MLLDGKKLALKLEEAYKQLLLEAVKPPPTLAVVLVGDNPASHLYVNNKAKACQRVGITSKRMNLSEETTENQLLELIHQLNSDPEINGILVQLPLPEQIDPTKITRAVAPEKDVDGFHPLNLGKLLLGDSDGFCPCTPLGIQLLLNHSEISISGKRVVIVGRSNIVGKPLAALLMQKKEAANATVTLAHSQSEGLTSLCQEADILISAIGKAHFITEERVKEGAVVVDVGINRIDGKLVGDVDFDNVKNKVAAITPVPGGVGPMTIAMLLYNTIKSYSRRYPECIDLSPLSPFSLHS